MGGSCGSNRNRNIVIYPEKLSTPTAQTEQDQLTRKWKLDSVKTQVRTMGTESHSLEELKSNSLVSRTKEIKHSNSRGLRKIRKEKITSYSRMTYLKGGILTSQLVRTKG